MLIDLSTPDVFCLSSNRHRKVVPNPHSVQADTHDYFLRRPKAGRLHPSSKSGPGMIISYGDLRLVGSARHQKVVQNPHSILLRSGWWPCCSVWWCSKDCTRTLTIYGVARGLIGALRLDGWCSKKLHQNPHPVYYSKPYYLDFTGYDTYPKCDEWTDGRTNGQIKAICSLIFFENGGIANNRTSILFCLFFFHSKHGYDSL